MPVEIAPATIMVHVHPTMSSMDLGACVLRDMLVKDVARGERAATQVMTCTQVSNLVVFNDFCRIWQSSSFQ